MGRSLSRALASGRLMLGAIGITRLFRGALAGLFLGALAGFFLGALAGPGIAGAEIVDRIAASVNDVAIPESELRRALAVSALRPEPAENPEAFRARVLDALIDQKLQYREALRFGPPSPSPAEVDTAVARLRERLRGEGRDPDAEFAAAGLTPPEVRAALERQIVVQSYLQERFRPIAFADEEQAKTEYDKFSVPAEKAAGREPKPFEAVADEMRRRAQQRAFDEESQKWMKEIRQKARITIFPATPPPVTSRTPVAMK